MNFFEQQAAARRNTTRLALLFVAAIISLVALSELLIIALLKFSAESEHPITLSLSAYIGIAVGICVVIALASLYKFSELNQGGKAVALALDGKLLDRATKNIHERKLVNVVEEMAIASGTPVPAIYILEDKSINAFAAGYGPHDAIIGVTRGTMELLSRDELQGVVAHEFSHIFNGDMRINLRLVGLLFGILFVALIGQRLLMSMRFSRSKNSMPVVLMGVGFMAIGYGGLLFGNLIKAAISRQREFLADASAVQYTRNPEGIGGALKKIGSVGTGSQLVHANAAEFSHCYIASGTSMSLQGLFATHPPLSERIRRIDKRWDGKYISTTSTIKPDATKSTAQDNKNSPRDKLAAIIPTAAVLQHVLDQTGMPTAEHVAYAHQLIANIPSVLHTATNTPAAASATLVGLMLGSTASQRTANLNVIGNSLPATLLAQLENLLPALNETSIEQRLPIMELCLAALKELSASEIDELQNHLKHAINADQRFELWEWALYRLIDLGLRQTKPAAVRFNDIKELADDCAIIFSLLAYRNQDATLAFQQAAKLAELTIELTPKNLLRHTQVETALTNLAQLKPLAKPKFLKALCAAINSDGVVQAEEIELLRAIAATIDCPVPPLKPS
ncbi:MAG: M48 family metallopeptidase [Gammaproteobacteria bacterium]|nr:M48 family metallopeptidase [Gammaproteobacteria bacterium]